MRPNNNHKGFSLIEMLVVATIAALLAAAGLASYSTLNRNSRNARRESDLQQVRAAMELYRAEHPSYPSVPTGNEEDRFISLVDLLKPEYLSGGDFVDPRDAHDDFGYRYRSSPTSTDCTGKSYEICARMEEAGGNEEYCVCNP